MLENGQKKGESARGFHSEAADAFCFVRMMKPCLPPLRIIAQGRQVYKTEMSDGSTPPETPHVFGKGSRQKAAAFSGAKSRRAFFGRKNVRNRRGCQERSTGRSR